MESTLWIKWELKNAAFVLFFFIFLIRRLGNDKKNTVTKPNISQASTPVHKHGHDTSFSFGEQQSGLN